MKKKILFIAFLFGLFFIVPNVEAADVNFKGVDYYSSFQVNSHYIITVYNPSDTKWYAVGVGDSGEPVTIKIDNPKNGLKFDKKELKTSNYIFTGSKKPANYSIKLRSNIIDEASGKKYSLYLNSSVFNLGGGDIRLNKNQYNPNEPALFALSYRNSNYLTFNKNTKNISYENYPESYYYNFNGIINNYYYSNSDKTMFFYILTDDEGIIEDNKETTLKRISTIGAVRDYSNYYNISDKTQFVYTSGNDKYIITPDGAKKVNISNNSLKTKDYFTMNYNSNYYYDNFTNGYVYNDEYLVEDMKDTRYGYSSYFYLYNAMHQNYKFLNLDYYNGGEELFMEDNYYYYYNSLYLFYKTPYTTSLFTDQVVNPVTDEDYLNVAFNVPAKFKICNYYVTYSSNSNTRCIGWDSVNKEFIKVNNINDAALFDVYSNREVTEKKTVIMHAFNSSYSSTLTTVTDHDLYRIDNKLYPYVNSEGIITYNNYNYRLLGFTTNPNKAGIVRDVDNYNIMDYNKSNRRVELTESFKQKYSIVDRLSDAKVVNGVIDLYPVVANENTKEEAYVGKNNNKNIIGVMDWKNTQEGKTDLELAKYDINQGSINIEVYKDGKLWLPKEKVYYKYHNDNAADLNIKFLNDNITDINSYLTSKDDFQKSPDNLVIVGVYAEQGGSEEGLYEPFNWINEDGGQIDNVKGGSTVKIYLSTKYTSKYYLNEQLYKTDKLVYTPTITKNTIKNNSKNSAYVVNRNTNSELFNNNTSGHFKEANLLRGEYSTFSYEIANEKDVMDVLNLPDEVLKYDYWIVKDEGNKVVGKALGNQIVQIESKDAVNFLYIGDEDSIDTIHLYAYTPKYKNIPSVPDNTPIISTSKYLINPDTGIKNYFVVFAIALVSSISVFMVLNKKKYVRL